MCKTGVRLWSGVDLESRSREQVPEALSFHFGLWVEAWVPTAASISVKSDSKESVAFQTSKPYACSYNNDTANDSIVKTAVFFLPARLPALKRLKAARLPDEQSSSTAPSLRNVLAFLWVLKLLQVSCANVWQAVKWQHYRADALSWPETPELCVSQSNDSVFQQYGSFERTVPQKHKNW